MRARPAPPADRAGSASTLGAIGAAMTPVMFAYGGWQTASFVAAEMRDPRRDLARGLLLGRDRRRPALHRGRLRLRPCARPAGLAASKTPASAVMRLALGDTGATLIALGIAISALGFLSQGMLTAPRVYFAMAEDGLFFRKSPGGRARPRAGRRDRPPGRGGDRDRLSGTYGQILSYVVSVDFIWFGLTGAALFVFRAAIRAAAASRRPAIPSPPACSSSPAR
jgi:APA family basic amino acid/polyamine antiporter